MDQGNTVAHEQSSVTPAPHTPTPWFVSGVRFRMNGGEWLSINRYDEAKKQDENIACLGYDPRTGLGFSDAHFIVRAVNSHDTLVEALEKISKECWLDDYDLEFKPTAGAEIAIAALAAASGNSR